MSWVMLLSKKWGIAREIEKEMGMCFGAIRWSLRILKCALRRDIFIREMEKYGRAKHLTRLELIEEKFSK